MYRNILVAADGSEAAARAVERAAEVAQATGARVTVLTVGGPADRALAIARAEADRVNELTAGAVTAEAKADAGDPSTQILAEARTGGYDLLVVGNKGMTGASRFLHTSVPKVSHHAPIALLIVRTT